MKFFSPSSLSIPGLKIWIIFLLLLGYNSLLGQEWLDEIMGAEKSRAEMNFFQIQSRAEILFKNESREYFARSFKTDDYPELKYKSVKEYIEYKRWEEYWENHIGVDGIPVPRLKEFEEFTNYLKSSNKGEIANWLNINRTEAPGGYWGMGRVREIAFHPTDQDIFWLGTDQGGIWKTTDNGLTYTPIGDGLPFLRVSSLCVNPSDPDIIYMLAGGTGTSWWDPSIGVYKTTDGGLSWDPTGSSFDLSEVMYHRRLVMSPTDPDLLLYTSDQGVFRSTDGADTWTKTLNGDCWDMAFHPDGTTIIAASAGELYRSENSGVNWTKVTSNGLGGRMNRISISPVNSDKMAAQLNTTLSSTSYSIYYTSEDRGATWVEKSRETESTGGSLGFSSTDENKLYRGWESIYSSSDFGETWVQVTHWYDNGVHTEVHADFFKIKKNPNIENRLYFCNDGGLYYLDESDMTWTERSAGLIISQYYSLSSSQSDPNVLLCGSQDNGGWYRTQNGTWRTSNGGDGMHTWQHPTKPLFGYSSYPGGKIYRTLNGWGSYSEVSRNINPTPSDGDWNSRYAVDPNNDDIIVTGCYSDVYRSVDKGGTWKRVSVDLTGGRNLHCIIIPESNSNYIYTAAGAYLYKSENSGLSWTRLATPGSMTIREIIADPYNHQRIWIVKNGFNAGQKVFQSEDGGRTWTNISGSLPNLPALSIEYQKGTNDGLYVGMTYGIYYKNASMNDWVYYGHGIPNTEIRDIDIQYSTGKVRCATYGRGLFETDLYPITEPAPDSRFTSANSEICLTDTIWFINESLNADVWRWNFGDGSFSDEFSPYHVYELEGNYSVSLISYNSQQSDINIKESYISVDPLISPLKVGQANRDNGSGYYISDDNIGMIFNAKIPIILRSVKVYTFAVGKRRFIVEDSNGVVISEKEILLTQGENRVSLNFNIPAGNNYVLKILGENNLFHNSEGANYPYGKSDLVSIVGNTSFEKDKYFFFYDWVVQYISCSNEILPIVTESDNVAVDRIIVSPNPVSDNFRVLLMGFENNEDVYIRLYTIEGLEVYQTNLGTEREVNLNRSLLPIPSGAIIIEARSKTTTASKRIITLL
jgi:PKD repeat protein